MINQYLYYSLSDTRGYVEAVNVHPDGRVIAKIHDRWFFVEELSSE